MDSSPPIPPADSPDELSTLAALAALPGPDQPRPNSVQADVAISRPLPSTANVRPYLVSDQTNPMDAQEDRPAVGTGEVPAAARLIMDRHTKVVAAFKDSDLKIADDPHYRKIVMDALVTIVGTYVIGSPKDAADAAPAGPALTGILGGSLAAQAAVGSGLNLDADLTGEPG